MPSDWIDTDVGYYPVRCLGGCGFVRSPAVQHPSAHSQVWERPEGRWQLFLLVIILIWCSFPNIPKDIAFVDENVVGTKLEMALFDQNLVPRRRSAKNPVQLPLAAFPGRLLMVRPSPSHSLLTKGDSNPKWPSHKEFNSTGTRFSANWFFHVGRIHSCVPYFNFRFESEFEFWLFKRKREKFFLSYVPSPFNTKTPTFPIRFSWGQLFRFVFLSTLCTREECIYTCLYLKQSILYNSFDSRPVDVVILFDWVFESPCVVDVIYKFPCDFSDQLMIRSFQIILAVDLP